MLSEGKVLEVQARLDSEESGVGGVVIHRIPTHEGPGTNITGWHPWANNRPELGPRLPLSRMGRAARKTNPLQLAAVCHRPSCAHRQAACRPELLFDRVRAQQGGEEETSWQARRAPHVLLPGEGVPWGIPVSAGVTGSLWKELYWDCSCRMRFTGGSGDALCTEQPTSLFFVIST